MNLLVQHLDLVFELLTFQCILPRLIARRKNRLVQFFLLLFQLFILLLRMLKSLFRAL